MGGLLREGETIKFGGDGNYSLWAASGWSRGGEGDITWIDGHVGTLEFSMIEARGDRTLNIGVLPAEGDWPHQMYVYLNGRLVGFVSASIFKEATWPLPRDYFRVGAELNVLTFVCPTSAIPAELGRSLDKRTLGFAFSVISISGSSAASGAPEAGLPPRPRPPFRRPG